MFIELNYGYEGPILLHSKEIECTGEELGLSDCAGYEIGTHSCFGPSGIEIKCPGQNYKEYVFHSYTYVCGVWHYM